MRQLKHLDLIAPEEPDELIYTPTQLSRFVRYIHDRLETIFKIGTGAILAMSLAFVAVVFVGVTYTLGRQHDQCVSSNNGRAEIKAAFRDLYDGFVLASPADKKALARAFGDGRMKKLEKGLPQRDC